MVSEALILQLGSFVRYKLYHTRPHPEGAVLQCHLHKRHTNPPSYVLLTTDLGAEACPPGLLAQLSKKGRAEGGGDEEE